MIKRTPMFALMACCALPAYAQRFCVYDPTGTQGPAYALATDYAVAAKAWGVTLQVKAYTDERVASEDFKAGQCDGVVITGLRGRQYNHYVGSLDSLGAVPSYRHLRMALQVLASPQSAVNMKNDRYEVVGLYPLGAAYVFVRDRSINSIEKAAGKKIAVLDFDKTQAKLVQQLGAQPVSSDITNFTTKFNNGQVDIVAAPGIAYKPFEMYKGLGERGAIYRFPLLQLTMHLIVRRDRFPADFGQMSRQHVYQQLERAEKTIQQAEREIPAKYWLDLSRADQDKYTLMMRQARVQLTQDGYYDPKMMSLLKKVRCRFEPSAGECAEAVE